MKRFIFFVIGLTLLLPSTSVYVRADSLSDAINYCIGIAFVSQEFGDDFVGEAQACGQEILVYLQQQAAALIPFVGQANINGVPVRLLPGGTSATLTFQFIDPAAGTVVVGPAVGYVDYQANLDPTLPNQFVDLGISSDALSNFALTYVIPRSGEEPVILAIPFDANGNPIFITGTAGSNDAVGLAFNATTPEPSEFIPIGIACCMLVGRTYRRRKKASAVNG